MSHNLTLGDVGLWQTPTDRLVRQQGTLPIYKVAVEWVRALGKALVDLGFDEHEACAA